MSQRSDNGIRKIYRTYQTASFAQCSGYDNLRSISLNIHLLIFYEPENRRTEASVAWREIKDKNWLQYWMTKTAANSRRNLVNCMLQEQKSWEHRCLLQERSTQLVTQGPQNGPNSAFKKVWAQSSILKSEFNVHSSLATSFHEPTIADTALFWKTLEFWAFESGGLKLNKKLSKIISRPRRLTFFP